VVLVVAIPKFGNERLSMIMETLEESEPTLVLVLVHDCTKATIGYRLPDKPTGKLA
jgi:hypothetical protein